MERNNELAILGGANLSSGNSSFPVMPPSIYLTDVNIRVGEGITTAVTHFG